MVSESAIVRGAALIGLQGIRPKTRRFRRHYGLARRVLFREGIDPDDCTGHLFVQH
ncbi:hypothetical protein BGW36DRAFT_290720 [Talaromyces proteolyticus]|uniref:Uncharacterized protein n=1 Tax=Talaromyces proteolyticus TaxID=1131652 RepID=A0AAD4KX16_9EURO|nr:uncharacterized protein BGW36DRAFT_290720 [Talaromyces proteolyticus]KAH8702054.1 hypothetical protein BGW36DRAFT_290720 [Talaromyces proteolyticus]